jgi:hypothetical protein
MSCLRSCNFSGFQVKNIYRKRQVADDDLLFSGSEDGLLKRQCKHVDTTSPGCRTSYVYNVVTPQPHSPKMLRWELMFEYLKEFGTKYGHFEVPWNYKVSLDSSHQIYLGLWLGMQYQRMYSGILAPHHCLILESPFNFKDRCLSLTEDSLIIFDILPDKGEVNSSDSN